MNDKTSMDNIIKKLYDWSNAAIDNEIDLCVLIPDDIIDSVARLHSALTVYFKELNNE